MDEERGDGWWMCPHHGREGGPGEECRECREHWGLYVEEPGLPAPVERAVPTVVEASGPGGRSHSWPDKTVAEFSDDELATAIEQREGDRDPVTRDLVRSCWQEWERRRGLTTTV
ncbi:hypothetical protein ACFC26_41285 [Kitasatospora purpeofusca]|uniref:hypothetical protein n=1 Tax=Kitasatospora purpeofusca TaxID=67352 RepID=UPI0035E2D7A0